jgi:hypothetical protein
MDQPNLEFIKDFRNAILALDTEIACFFVSGASLEDLGAALVELNRAKAEVGMCYDYAVNAMNVKMADNPELALPDGSKIEKKWANTRTGWQHKDLANTVARRIVDLNVDMDTGEILASPEQMLVQIFDYVQPSYWRIKELQKISVNPDEYCEVHEAKPSIIVRKGNAK